MQGNTVNSMSFFFKFRRIFTIYYFIKTTKWCYQTTYFIESTFIKSFIELLKLNTLEIIQIIFSFALNLFFFPQMKHYIQAPYT